MPSVLSKEVTKWKNPLETYSELVKANPDMIRVSEKMLKMLTYFSPMRIGEGSINVEAFSTLVELLPLYHDHILKEDTQITLDCGMETKFVKSVKVLLEGVKRSQILIELYFIYKAKSMHWNMIIALEFIKAICRCYLVLQAKGRMLVLPEDCQTTTLKKLDALDPESQFNDLESLYICHGRDGSNPNGHFSKHTQTLHPEVAIPTKDARKTIGDLLFFLRPFVYAFILKYRKWPAFFTSLFMDLFSIICHLQTKQTPRERSELIRRLLLGFFYIFRSPFYQDFVRDPLIQLFLKFSSIPILGFLGTMVVEIIKEGVPYFYVSGS